MKGWLYAVSLLAAGIAIGETLAKLAWYFLSYVLAVAELLVFGR